MSFDKALDHTLDALRTLRDHGAQMRGSRAALERLAATRPTAPERPAAATAAPVRPAERPQPQAAPLPLPVSLPISMDVFPAGEGSREQRLNQLREAVLACVKCDHLARSRTQAVVGVGDPEARIMFVGEAPGADEDELGEPFVGKAGQLLTKIIVAMGLSREEVYIANVLKCRPDMPPGSTGNRRPTSGEMQTCLPYLRAQIEIIRPAVLVALGGVAMEGLLGSVEPMSKLRGRWHEFQGIPLMATYHPAYLLRNQSLGEKRKVWDDMLMVMERAGLPISEKQRGFFLK